MSKTADLNIPDFDNLEVNTLRYKDGSITQNWKCWQRNLDKHGNVESIRDPNRKWVYIRRSEGKTPAPARVISKRTMVEADQTQKEPNKRVRQEEFKAEQIVPIGAVSTEPSHLLSRISMPSFFPIETKDMDSIITLYEKADERRLRALIKNPHIESNLKKKLKGYMKNWVATDTFKVEYTYSRFAYNESGRLSARSGFGFQHFTRDVRAYLCGHLVDDIDQINSLPTILSQLFKRHNITCAELDEYVSQRASVLERERLTKEAVIIAMNNKHPPRSQFLKIIHECVYKRLVPILQQGDGFYATYWQHILKMKHLDVKDNREGTFVALVTQTLENQCLQSMSRFFRGKGAEVNSFIFDGLTILKPKLFETRDVLKECQAHVKNETGFDMPLTVKPMTLSENFYQSLHIDPYKEENSDAEELNDNRDGKSKANEISWDFINEEEGWEKFDHRAFFEPSDLNLARWFLMLRGDTIKKHSSGVVWVLGGSNIWQMAQDIHKTDLRPQIADTISARAIELVERILIPHLSANPETIPGIRKRLTDLRAYLESASHSRNIAEMIYCICPTDDSCIQSFLSTPHLVAFSDCVYDLNMGTDMPIQPEHYVVRTTGYRLPRTSDPVVREHIMRFYTSIFSTSEIRDYRLKVVARELFGRMREEVFYVLKGRGGNGKGSEDKLIEKTFGDYYKYITQNNLSKAASEPDKPNAQLFDCFLKRHISTSETSPGDKFMSAIIKPITANDPFPVRTLHGKPITFPFTGGLHIQTNDEIEFDKVDPGMMRRPRVLLYPFTFVPGMVEKTQDDDDEGGSDSDYDSDDEGVNSTFEKPMDMSLKDKLTSEEYRDEFMLMLLDIYKKDLKDRQLEVDTPAEVLILVKKLMTNSLSCSKWFQQHYKITQSEDDRLERSTLFKHYKESVGCMAIGKHTFFNEIRSLCKEKTSKGKRYFTGLTEKKVMAL
ncbi:hypothetical protein HDV00_009440 [Rhizophlyctis rosea]|nr:hypothetical protein HDV00_009440 [Rhizophlyctis rosea]